MPMRPVFSSKKSPERKQDHIQSGERTCLFSGYKDGFGDVTKVTSILRYEKGDPCCPESLNHPLIKHSHCIWFLLPLQEHHHFKADRLNQYVAYDCRSGD